MAPTPYPDVNEVIERLVSEIKRVFGHKLVGLYLYGSLVTGDFNPHSSDIDMVAVLASEMDETEYDALHRMHRDFAHTHERWDDRIEVVYLSATALRTYRNQSSMIAIISPGEPFHLKEAGMDWLMNWYLLREHGIVLTGPSPQTLIDPISKEEFLSAVYRHAQEWRAWIKDTFFRGAQAYAILTMCRVLHTLKMGEHCSKKQAAVWAQKEWPEWSMQIQQALVWREARRDDNVDHEATLPQTRQFVQFALHQCEQIYDTLGC